MRNLLAITIVAYLSTSLLAREWTDVTGKFKLEAYGVSVDKDGVRLKKKDGAIVVVPLSSLAGDDRKYAEELAIYDESLAWLNRSQPTKAEVLLKNSQHPLNRALRGFLLCSNLRGQGFSLHDPAVGRAMVVESLTWLSDERDDARVAELFGMLYMEGVGIEQDLQQSISFLQYATKFERPSATAKLGLLYAIGQGVEQSDVRAKALFEAASLLGNPSAQVNLAVLLSRDAQTEPEADLLLRKAAREGHPRAMCALARKKAQELESLKELQPPTSRAEQLAYAREVAKRQRLYNVAMQHAEDAIKLGYSDGICAKVVVLLSAKEPDAETTKSVLALIEEAAKADSVPAIILLCVYLRDDDVRPLLDDPNQDTYELLNRAKSLDKFGEFNKIVEECAFKWQKEDEEAAEADAAYQRRLAGAKLLLIDWNWKQTAGSFLEVNGQVKNLSKQKLSNVTVVVSFFTEDGTFITSDSAIISFNPLLPNQTSPFTMSALYNPAMSNATIDFKILLGGTIPWVKMKASK